MKNITVNNKDYTGVQKINVPIMGATDEYAVYVDTTDATATAEDISKGKNAYVDGVLVEGIAEGGSGNLPAGLVEFGQTLANAKLVGKFPWVKSRENSFDNNVVFPYDSDMKTYMVVTGDNNGIMLLSFIGNLAFVKGVAPKRSMQGATPITSDSVPSLFGWGEAVEVDTGWKYPYRCYNGSQRVKDAQDNGGYSAIYDLGGGTNG